MPDEGIRSTDSDIAIGIKERESRMGIRQSSIVARYAGPDCFNRKPNFQGGGQGKSTAEIFAENGIYIIPGDPSRALKIRQFRERLRVPRDADGIPSDRPMMQVYSTCKDFIRTIPSLCMDEINPEDIDTDQEDHIYDEACHICMARPIGMSIPASRIPAHEKRIQQLYDGSGSDSYTDYAVQEQAAAMKDFGAYESGIEAEEFDDGNLYNTV